jgi:large subunit ribosomal protein L35
VAAHPAALRVADDETERDGTMPKMKSHSGTGKRVKVTGSGKLVRQKAGKRHKLEKKPSTMTRRMTGITEVSKADAKNVKKLLGR